MVERAAVSVVIPVYNAEKYLRRCLDSVLNQSFQDWEAVCVNDGSIDGSLAILKEYAKCDSRFKVVDKKNGGASDARNVGVQKASGEYILFLDSDDFIHSQLLEITFNLAQQNSADMVSFGYDKVFHKKMSALMNEGKDISEILPDLKDKKYRADKIRFKKTDCPLFHSTERNRGTWGRVKKPVHRHCFPVLCLYSADLIKNISFIRGIILEDFPWWCAVLLKRPQTVLIDLPLYFYMPNPSSQLNSTKSLRFVNSIAVGLENVFNAYKENATPKEFNYVNREFIWPFAFSMVRQARNLDNLPDREVASRTFARLFDIGVFDKTCSLRSRRYKKKIKKIINM